MNQLTIFYPLFALVALTFFVAFKMGALRFIAVKRKDLTADYFLLNQGSNLPEYLAKYSNNYDNLLASPLLFYVWTILIYVTHSVHTIDLALSAVYVVTRYFHSYVHLTTNVVKIRGPLFIFSMITLLVMWASAITNILMRSN